MSRIQRFIDFLSRHEWLEAIEIETWEMRKARYIEPGRYEYATGEASEQNLQNMQSVQGTTYFLSKQLEIPKAWNPQQVALVFEAGGEALLRINGETYHGLDRNHWFVPMPLSKAGSTPLLEIELYDPIPEPVDPLNAQAVINPPIRGVHSKLVRVNEPIQSLKYAVTVADMAAKLLPERDMRRIHTEQALNQAMDALYGAERKVIEDGEYVRGVERRLSEAVAAQMPKEAVPGTMHMVGQSHIDVAWLWPVRETVRKVSRTFSTVCTLMDRYPDFKYSQSQPQLYAFVKEYYPDLYEKIKVRIAEGRWELVGGMWVEPDLNIPNGESLARQILYGQNFYEKEFGQRSHIEWLPDTFGYCASLPQLLKLSGVDYFMTTKLGWNDTNKFPYDLFNWVGIDGTTILSYQNHGLNEHTHPKDVREHWESFGQRDVHDELMLLYGHGDGGGGVTHEMVEYVNRAKLMPGLPLSRFATAAEFFDAIGDKALKLPEWHGDLYLELHRGTYTTHARNKYSNRKAEVLFRETEIWSQLGANYIQQGEQVKAMLDQGWKLMLLNQFHDIIPGTSIPEVYVTSAKQYEEIFKLGRTALDQAVQAVASRVNTDAVEGTPYILFNSLGWQRDEVVVLSKVAGSDTSLGKGQEEISFRDEQGPLEFDLVPASEGDALDAIVRVTGIPAFGYKTIWLTGKTAAEASSVSNKEANQTLGQAVDTGFNRGCQPGQTVPPVWETPNYVLTFDTRGAIAEWLDKRTDRPLISAGAKGNDLQFYHDTPTYWDAWDIDPRYESQPAGSVELVNSEIIAMGAVQDRLRFQWKISHSVITQELVLNHHTRRVDFNTHVSWQEEHKLLKVAFPVDIVASKATYEIQFGALERSTHRNTSWEQAQFEVCGYRWADLSEGGFGISLLNDCKYGYDIKNGVMRLSLLRAPKWPDHGADQGDHTFTYSLYPHQEDWRKAQVVRQAAQLNHPVLVVPSVFRSGELNSIHAWIGLDSEHTVLDTVKQAEDGSGVVLRFYESTGGREQIKLWWPDDMRNVRAYLTNLLEDEAEELAVSDGAIELSFKPYEIKTIKLKISSS